MSKPVFSGLGATLLALLLALGLAGAASAGGWSVVVLDSASALIGVDRPVDAGAPFTVGFTVLQHGKTPVDGLAPTLTLTGAGERLSFTAGAEGGPGHYVATITLPEAGTWEWQIDAFGPPATMAPISVVAPAPAAPPVAPAPLPYLAFAVIAAIALGAVALLAMRARRAAPAAR